MSQISVELNPELEHALAEYMKLRHIETEAEAIRAALAEVVEHSKIRPDFSHWLGLGLQAPENPEPSLGPCRDRRGQLSGGKPAGSSRGPRAQGKSASAIVLEDRR